MLCGMCRCVLLLYDYSTKSFTELIGHYVVNAFLFPTRSLLLDFAVSFDAVFTGADYINFG